MKNNPFQGREVIVFRALRGHLVEVPVADVPANCGVTGFPSPADDHLDKSLDLNNYFQIGPTTYFIFAYGQSMIDADIQEGDVLIVDTNVDWRNREYVVCRLNNEVLVKRVEQRRGRYFLTSANPKFVPVEITEFDDAVVFGPVVGQARKRR